MKGRTIVIFPGRFHPFGPHHRRAYGKLTHTFGEDDTYIVSSNVTNRENSPFSFDEKQSCAMHQGISPDHFVQVRQPYKPIELLQNFNPDKDVAIFACGRKDQEKMLRNGKYFEAYDPTFKHLQPFRRKGYVYTIPDIDLKLPTGEKMSGTSIRNFLSNADEEQFEQVMGFYDENLHMKLKQMDENYYLSPFNLTNDIIKELKMLNKLSLTEELRRERVDYYYEYLSNLVPESFKVERIGTTVSIHVPPYLDVLNEKVNIDKKKLLTEGGALGSLKHPYDELDLTFGDFKNIINDALAGKLNFKEQQPAEKTDGQNLMVTYKDGEIKAARNKKTIKDPMSVSEIEDFFDGKKDVKEAFTFALQDLEKALSRVAEDKLKKIFKDGKRFLNVEILYPKTQNVVVYGPKAYLQFNGVYEYDKDGNKTDSSVAGGEILQKLVRRVNGHIQDKFEIIPPNAIRMRKDVEFDKYKSYFLNNLETLQNEFDLEDSHEVSKYHQRWWENYVNKQFPKITDETKAVLVQRWAYNDKSQKITKEMFTDDNHYKLAQKIDKKDYKPIAEGNMLKFETIFLELGIRVLHNVDNFLSATKPEDYIQDVKDKVKSLKKQIKRPEDLSKMQALLQKIENLGGFDELVPSEGIVFTYKGKEYKLTGLFAPVNQLLGLVRYSKY